MARARTNPETAIATDKPPIPAQSPTVNGGDIARRANTCIWHEAASLDTMWRTGCRRSENCKSPTRLSDLQM